MKLATLYWRSLGWVALGVEALSRRSVNGVEGSIGLLLIPATFAILWPFLIWNLPYILTNYRFSQELFSFLVVMLLITTASAILTVLWVICLVFGCVIFRRDSRGETDPIQDDTFERLENLGVSGEFEWNGHRRRFVNVPAAYVGNRSYVAFESAIDASTTFLGLRVIPGEGMWRLEVASFTIEKRELGTLYLGKTVRPALCLRYKRESDGDRDRVVVSFETEAQRTAFIDLLY